MGNKRERASKDLDSYDQYGNTKWKWLDDDKAEKSKRRQKALAKGDQGHFVVHDPKAFRSKKGKSDSYNAFSYIKLNPAMLNKRNRKKGEKTFDIVVDKKKAGKRMKDGMLAGAKIK